MVLTNPLLSSSTCLDIVSFKTAGIHKKFMFEGYTTCLLLWVLSLVTLSPDYPSRGRSCSPLLPSMFQSKQILIPKQQKMWNMMPLAESQSHRHGWHHLKASEPKIMHTKLEHFTLLLPNLKGNVKDYRKTYEQSSLHNMQYSINSSAQMKDVIYHTPVLVL